MPWYRSFALSAVFAGQLLVGGWKVAFAQAQPSLQIRFDARGLSAVTYGGNNVLQPKPMKAQLDLRHMFPPTPSTLPSGGPAVSFDAAAQKAVQSYPWGTLECTYRADGDHLLMDVAIHNTSKESIFGFSADLLQLKLAGDVKVQDWWRGWPEPSQLNDAPEILDVATDDCSIAICNEEVTRPLYMNIRRDKGGIYTLVMRHDGPPRGQEIGGGDSREFHFSLRFGPKGTNSLTLADDIYKKFAAAYPGELKWDDHRSIGCCFVSEIESRSPTNPTGWLHDSHVDMTTDAGRADWKKRMLGVAEKSSSVAKEMNCQGVIVWDIEGQRMPHVISYIGDPRLMPELSPEMDPVADEFFKKFTDKGLRTGVTLRTTHVVKSPGAKNEYEHVIAEDIAAELSGKIDYCKKRWGCTLFYVDSTLRWDLSAEGDFQLHTLPAVIFQALHAKYPDVLLIPEQTTTRYHAYTAPYHEIMPPHNYLGTPDVVRAVYPDAFSVIRVADKPLIEKDSDALIAAVKSGDILMFRTWYDDPDNIPVKKILEAAAAKQ